MKRAVVLFVVFIACAVFAQELVVTNMDGGSVKTSVNFTAINKKSTLRRQWIIINDTECPVQLVAAGVTTSASTGSPTSYYYSSAGTAQIGRALSAFKICHVLYDLFGGHIKTLSSLTVQDFPDSSEFKLDNDISWRAWETEVRELLIVVSFVSDVRMQTGDIWHYEETKISDELNKLKLKFIKNESNNDGDEEKK